MQNQKRDNFFEEEIDIGEEAVVEYDITTSPRDLTPANIVDMIDSGIMEVPLFQRNYVWDKKKASKLIESLILGLPVPELFFYSENDDTTYKIIDGQQRLLSIYFFVKGRFPKNTDSRLIIRTKINNCQGNYNQTLDALLADNSIFEDFELLLNDPGSQKPFRYHGKKFATLDRDTQIKFRLRRYLRTVVVRQNKPDNNGASMFEIFNRLNTGGTPLNHQEIRASLYYCNFYDMLVRVNENAGWRNILGKTTQDLHCNDIEMILRSLALLQDGQNYAPRMATFLNSFSQKSRSFSTEHVNYLEELFLSFIDACSALSEKAFFRNSRFSKTLFESVFVSACQQSFKKGTLLSQTISPSSFDALKSDELFASYLMEGSSSTENIRKRIKRASEIIRFEGECRNG